MTTPTPADRLALAVCASSWSPPASTLSLPLCRLPCIRCRHISQAHAHELATILRERHGSSTTADWLEAIGSHQPTTETP